MPKKTTVRKTSSKKNTSRSNKKPQKTAMDTKVKRELFGIIIIGLGIFFGATTYFSSATGVLGEMMWKLIFGLFGGLGYVIPIACIAFGVFLIALNPENKSIKTNILVLILMFFVTSILDLLFIDKLDTTSFAEFMKSTWLLGTEGIGGGAFFAPIMFLLLLAADIVGTYIILMIVLIASLVVLTPFSIALFSKKVYNTATAIKPDIKKRGTIRSDYIKTKIPVDKKNKQLIDPFELKSTRTRASKPVIEYVSGDNDEKEEIINETAEEEFDNIDVDTTIDDDEDEEIKIVDYRQQTFSDIEEEIEADEPPFDVDFKMDKTIKPIHSTAESDSDVIKEVNRPKPDYSTYKLPPMSLLTPGDNSGSAENNNQIIERARMLEDTLASYKVNVRVIQISRGPSITRFELKLGDGVKVKQIKSLVNDIAVKFGTPGIRIVAPIPGKAAVGVEVPNKDTTIVKLRDVLESEEFRNNTSSLKAAIGVDIAGKEQVADIAKMPHMLIAGATGMGKSVCLNSLIISLLMNNHPDDLKLILIDPKAVEMANYEGIPHLLIPVVVDPQKAASSLNWAVREMDDRYKLLKNRGVKKINAYNEKAAIEGFEKMPKIVVVIDEFADLMMVASKEVENAVCRIAQKARAAGIHLILATQRPSVNVITGLIKANIPSRIAFAVSSNVDSRTILDTNGAENLLGNGDMLYAPTGTKLAKRIQGSYITDSELNNVIKYIKDQVDVELADEIRKETFSEVTKPKKANVDESEHDELLQDAIEIVIEAGQASASMLQRRLRVGHARAGRLIDEMEIRGVIGSFEGSKPRKILISKEEFYRTFKKE